MKRHLLLLLVALLPILANAYDAKIDGIYYDFSGDEAIVTYESEGFNSYSGTVAIPWTENSQAHRQLKATQNSN